ncbi:flagellar hook-basal body complex protein FliE [Alcaligenes sp. SDU_A2]|uniref:flagellar hook-basal body complex protein FliE n=1 Tax=Alcaligenes sp. SDU_A2 TaxID=3136634 RepID=UPI002CCAECCA|nr:flagellar hook-basal body complex protein FliE [Alcaligenes sp.]HRL25955.1 flagellar hook-basal body complex protein FliE [Alcaligenes sp.]
MSISNLSSIEHVLAQMRAVAQAAGVPAAPAQAASSPDKGGFAAELARSLSRVSQAQSAANAQAQAFQLGEPGIALNDVMIDLQKASIAFQATVQMRNRLVAAYQEVASMPV